MTEERKFHHHHKDFLDSDERRRYLDPERILAQLPLVPSETVGDLGSGTGFFTEPLARRLTAGKVLAFDVQPEMVVALQERVARADLRNVGVARSQERRLPVADATLDGALVAFVLHETDDLGRFLTEVRRVVKPGGWLAVLEFHRREGTGGPPQHIRLEPDEVAAALAKAGFRVGDPAVDISEMHYLLLARG